MVRCWDWVYENNQDFLPSVTTEFHGKGGRESWQVMERDIHVLRRIRPDIVYLQVGGNDIKPGVTAERVLHNISKQRTVTMKRKKRLISYWPRSFNFREVSYFGD